MAYPGIYRAKAVRLNGTKLDRLHPPGLRGRAGDDRELRRRHPDHRRWAGCPSRVATRSTRCGTGGGGGGGTVTDVVWVDPKEPTSAAMELWYDTDEEAPLDSRYLPSAGGVMTGHITLPSTDPPGTYSAVHTTGCIRWINLANSATLLHRGRLANRTLVSGNGTALRHLGRDSGHDRRHCPSVRGHVSWHHDGLNRTIVSGSTVFTDIFVFTLYMGGSALAQAQTYSGGAYEWVGMSGMLGIAANTAATITGHAQRSLGPALRTHGSPRIPTSNSTAIYFSVTP